ncbi:MAG TPA: glycoside hydrolase family 97 catalytic domain-containing protein [Steroidobacteraceae bacterium]|nr:glycoside hydrolase family 97 catalytic domain-containing protein [Steroidobacteraceae bacterium]
MDVVLVNSHHKRRDFSRRALVGGVGAIALTAGTGCGLLRSRDPGGGKEPLNARQAKIYAVLSPSGLLLLQLCVPRLGVHQPTTWEVRHGKHVILLPSALGLRLADGNLLGPGAWITGHRRSSINASWHPPYGIRSEYQNRCEELALQLTDPASGIEFEIVARVYDEGVALRYILRAMPVHDASLELAGEATHFRFPPDAQLYASRDEGEYSISSVRSLAPVPHPDLTTSSDPEVLADIPLTAQLPGGQTLVVTESDRLGYPRMMMRSAADNPDALVTHLMRFPGRATGYSGPGETEPQENFRVRLPFATPWRVVMVGMQSREVIEHAGLVQSLATPSLLDDTSWIRPGRAIRSFRDNTTAGGLACVDFAVRRKLEYIEFDAHWYGDGTDPSDATVPIGGLDIEQIVRYAHARNVGVILYVDRVPAMRQLDEILRTYSRWGIAGIKFGFIWEGRQSDVQWIFDIVKKCGEHRMLVNLHDNLRPAGLERTLPNYMTLEGVRGNEQFPTARHNVTLPFTRNVAGPIDYTICYAHQKNQTTNAHQLAMAVVYYSPLAFLYWYDKPDKYAAGDWPALNFFDECPTIWDETRALAGEIGEYVVVARRRGQRWFLGAMTNEAPRRIEVRLSFLGAGVWNARIFADGIEAAEPNQTPVLIGEREVDSNQSLLLSLAPSGGQAILFDKPGSSTLAER